MAENGKSHEKGAQSIDQQECYSQICKNPTSAAKDQRCSHVFCDACIACSVIVRQDRFDQVKCIEDGCFSIIPLEKIADVIHMLTHTAEKLKHSAMEAHTKPRRLCTDSKCSGSFQAGVKLNHVVCDSCGLIRCLNCVTSHHGLSCEQYKENVKKEKLEKDSGKSENLEVAGRLADKDEKQDESHEENTESEPKYNGCYF